MELTGTVGDFNNDGLFGLIDADEGRLSLFNLSATPWVLRPQFRVGMRVTFELELTRTGRAVAPFPIGESADSAWGSMPPAAERGVRHP